MSGQSHKKKYLVVADSAMDLIYSPTERQYLKLCSVVARIEEGFASRESMEGLEDSKAKELLKNVNTRGVSIYSVPGGPIANIAQYLRKRGRDVSAISVIGNNPESRKYLDLLKNMGVDVRGVHTRKGVMPKCLYVYKSPEHQLPPIWRGNVSERGYVPQGEFFPEFINSHDAMLFSVTNPNVAVRILRDFNKTVAYNPGPIFDYLPFVDTRFSEIIARTTILSTNKSEAEQIVRNLHLRKMNDLFNDDNPNLEIIIKTKGAEGAEIYFRGDGTYEIDPRNKVWNIPPRQIIDDIGAGDAFFATAVDSIICGSTAEDILLNATMASQESLKHRGALNPRFLRGSSGMTSSEAVRKVGNGA